MGRSLVVSLTRLTSDIGLVSKSAFSRKMSDLRTYEAVIFGAALSIIWLSTSGTGAFTLVGDVAHLATLIARPLLFPE